MRALGILFFSIFVSLNFAAAQEAEVTAEAPTIRADDLRTTSFTFKTVYADYEYKEPTLMSIEGGMLGIEVAAAKELEGDKSIGGFVEYLTGEPRYVGGYMDGTPATHQTDHYFYTVGALYGAKFYPVHRSNFWELQGGLAHRYLNDFGKGPGSYEREQTYLYAPVILSYDSYFNEVTRVRTSIEVDVFLEGRNKSHAVIGNPDDTTNVYRQKSGNGGKLSLGVSRELKDLIVFADVYYRRWAIKDSTKNRFTVFNPNTGENENWASYEPNNKTTMLGLSAGVQF